MSKSAGLRASLRIKIVIALVASLLISGVFVSPASAHWDNAGHAWSHLKSYVYHYLSARSTINATSNPVHWTRLKGVPAGIADGVDNNGKYFRRKVVAGSGGDYTSLGAALAADSSVATATSPLQIYIAPGKYTLPNTIEMKEYIDIVGSGKNATILLSSQPNGAIRLAKHSTLSNLTVKNYGGNEAQTGIVASETDLTSELDSVRILVYGGSSQNTGLHIVSGSVTMHDSIVEVSGDSTTDGQSNVGINNVISHSQFNDVSIDVRGGGATGIHSEASSDVLVQNSRITAIGRDGYTGTGLVNQSDGNKSTILSSVISGSTASINALGDTAGSVLFSSGMMGGPVDASAGTLQCSGVFNMVTRTLLGNDCQALTP